MPLSFNPVWHLCHYERKLFSDPFLVKRLSHTDWDLRLSFTTDSVAMLEDNEG